jgi:hypothetical protein
MFDLQLAPFCFCLALFELNLTPLQIVLFTEFCNTFKKVPRGMLHFLPFPSLCVFSKYIALRLAILIAQLSTDLATSVVCALIA